jgi:LysR family transcriptional regulator, nitrogen assimilation regulatory protein
VLQQLETFCVVAEVGSLSRAAERLDLSQSAVTRQVRALERELGAVLLSRTPQGATLTPIGAAVLPHARAAVAAGLACRRVAADLAAGRGQRLSIAAGPMATQYLLPPVVARFRSLHPGVAVDLQPTHQRLALERLLRYEVDAVVLASPIRSAQVRAISILRDPLLLVGPPGAQPGPVRLAELAGATLLTLPAGTGLHEQVAAALRRRRVSCRAIEHPTAETIKTAVALGVGLSILPSSALRAELAAGALSGRPIEDWPGATRSIRLLMRAQGRPPAPVAAFAALLRAHYR